MEIKGGHDRKWLRARGFRAQKRGQETHPRHAKNHQRFVFSPKNGCWGTGFGLYPLILLGLVCPGNTLPIHCGSLAALDRSPFVPSLNGSQGFQAVEPNSGSLTTPPFEQHGAVSCSFSSADRAPVGAWIDLVLVWCNFLQQQRCGQHHL